MNDIIAKHSMDCVRYTKPVRAVDDVKYLTVDKQEKFLKQQSVSTITGNMPCCKQS